MGIFSSIGCLKRSGELSNQLDKGTDVVVFEKGNYFDLSIMNNLISYIKKNQFDIIHCHNPGTLLYGVMAGKFCNKKIVNTEHGFVDSHTAKSCIKDKLLYNLSEEITVVSDSLKKSLLNKFKIPPNKIHVIKNGIEPLFLENSKFQSKLKLGLETEYNYIGIVARLSPVKNHKAMIDAFKLITKQKPKTKLLIVGDGELREELHNYVEINRLNNVILFLGSRDDIPTILNALDIFVLSSNSEGLSMAIIEAMAAGLPVVATNVGGNKELVMDGINGLLVPPKCPESIANAVIKLVNNNSFATRLGNTGKDIFLNKFTINKMVEKFIEIYK